MRTTVSLAKPLRVKNWGRSMTYDVFLLETAAPAVYFLPEAVSAAVSTRKVLCADFT
jgi:hypothetical protein